MDRALGTVNYDSVVLSVFLVDVAFLRLCSVVVPVVLPFFALLDVVLVLAACELSVCVLPCTCSHCASHSCSNIQGC